MDKEKLEKFAALVLKFGVNLQKGQGLEIACPVEKNETAEAFTSVAYKMGAKAVRVRWEDEKIDRLNLLYSDETELTTVPKWFVESKNELVKKNFCYVAIAASLCFSRFLFVSVLCRRSRKKNRRLFGGAQKSA